MDNNFYFEAIKWFTFDYSDNLSNLHIRVDEPKQKLQLGVICTDYFYWAVPDIEPIETWKDIDLLEECFRHLREITDPEDLEWAYDNYLPILYVSKRRNMRPMPAKLDDMDIAVRKLFEAAGPERND